MLTNFTNYNQYISFISSTFIDNPDIFHSRLNDTLNSKALLRMIWIDINGAFEILKDSYSTTGRPAEQQAEILRSFILMPHFKYTSIKNWAARIKSDPFIAALIGSSPGNTPASSNHYDFLNRFIFFEHEDDNILPKGYFSSPEFKPKRNEKLNNINSNSVSELIDQLNSSDDFSRPEQLLQRLFNKIAVEFSLKHQLFDSSTVISGDGTSIHEHARFNGTKICNCPGRCSCDRRYSDPLADIGWDSDLGEFYFGYTGYTISVHNPKLKIDLPVFLTMASASQHDALTCILALLHFKDVSSLINPTHYCLDSASDNYATFNFLNDSGIIPIIDLNNRNTNNNIYEPYKDISKNGHPICQGNQEMVYCGADYSRQRHKYRCPVAVGKIESCPFFDTCTKSEYGRTIYLKFNTDIRLFGPAPYKSRRWINLYKNRTSCERVNDRILNDYKLAECMMRAKKRIFFLMIMIGINIHMDAFIKTIS